MTDIQRRSSFQVRDLRGRSLSPYRLPDGRDFIQDLCKEHYPGVKRKVDPCFPLAPAAASDASATRVVGPILHFWRIGGGSHRLHPILPRRSSALTQAPPPPTGGIPTAYIRTFPQQYKGKPQMRRSASGGMMWLSQPAPHRLGVGRPTPGRSSFRSELSRRRHFARRSGAHRSYHIPKPCQASRFRVSPRLSPTTPGDHKKRSQRCRPVR